MKLNHSAAALLLLLFPAALQGAEPQWIWSSKDRKPGQRAEFSKTVRVEAPVAAATLSCLAECARMRVYLNGELLHEQAPYGAVHRIDITQRLQRGENEILLRGVSTPGPAALLADLQLRFADGATKRVVSDPSWAAPVETAAEFGAADWRLLMEKERRVGVTAVDNYEQWKLALQSGDNALPAKFVTAPGFEISLVRSAKKDEDSWVSMAFDAEGRAIIAKEKQGLLRMTLDADGAKVVKVEPFAGSLKECRGLLFAHGGLYANANNSKTLYRLEPTADGFADPQPQFSTSGGVGHGRNDLALGPDGKICLIHGDSVRIPSGGPDYTSPAREARRGKTTSEGQWLRFDPETKQVEVLAAGLRNPFGIDFNEHGDAFTYDADAEFDMGAPWYRPTRVSHLTVGADFGWRGVTGSWPPYYPDHPDNAPFNLDIGKGSPTAVLFGTKADFPPTYRRALYVLDWAYGRIVAVHMWRRGASYLMSAETFLKGSPLNVTDLAVAPDGSMYLVTGGEVRSRRSIAFVTTASRALERARI